MQQYIQEWGKAFKRGVPMVKNSLGTTFAFIGGITLVLGLIAGAFALSVLNAPLYSIIICSILGVICLIIFTLAPYHGMRAIKNDVDFELNKTKAELEPFKKLKSQQEGKEWEWLRPVVEWIDLNRRGLADNQIMVRYQIDSGLTDDFQPYRMWFKLKFGEYEQKEWCEITEPINLLAGRRSQWCGKEITISDKMLLDRINLCRKGKEMSQTIRIAIQVRLGDEIRPLKSEYSVNPHSDFITEDEDTKL